VSIELDSCKERGEDLPSVGVVLLVAEPAEDENDGGSESLNDTEDQSEPCGE